MRLILALTLVPSIAMVLWLVSARRTPQAVGWFAGAVLLSLGGVAAGLASYANPHVTLAGQLGIASAFVALAVCTVAVIEAMASGPGTYLHRYRNGGLMWQVRTRVIEDRFAEHNGETLIYITSGNSKKVCGYADPEEMDTYLEAYSAAEQAAAQYNALGIGS